MSEGLQPAKSEIDQETRKFHLTETPELRESQYVHEVYNEIAHHFSQTRYKPWPIVADFLRSRDDYSLGVDIGCGNGKYLNVNDKLYIVGSDYSTGLISQAWQLHRKELNDTIVADSLLLPHADETFQFALSIAVIHHFSTPARRVCAISEVLRVLEKKGRALIYCWALEQENSRRGYKEGMDQDVLVPWVMVKKQEKKKSEDPLTCEAPATKMRYYHLYKRGELIRDSLSAGAAVIEDGYEKDNWWVVIEKA